jgi:transcription initiation factor IIF auxiliary subunit
MTMKLEQDFTYKGNDWWEWWIWIEAPDEELDEIKHVEYTLHPTFSKPVREIHDRETKFRLKTAGWGVFMIYAKAFLKNGVTVRMEHYLELEYPDGTKTSA